MDNSPELAVTFLWVLLVGMALALIPASIAKGKGRSFIGFWVYGILLWPIALIHALVMKDEVVAVASKRPTRKCPFCAEMILAEASVCRYCGKDLPPRDQTPIFRNSLAK